MNVRDGFLRFAEILACMSECPSAGYCLKAGRVECPTCPMRPEGVQRLVGMEKEDKGDG